MNKDYDDTGEDSGRKRIKSDEDFAAEKEAQDKARDELDVLVSSSFPREFLEQNTLTTCTLFLVVCACLHSHAH